LMQWMNTTMLIGQNCLMQRIIT